MFYSPLALKPTRKSTTALTGWEDIKDKVIHWPWLRLSPPPPVRLSAGLSHSRLRVHSRLCVWGFITTTVTAKKGFNCMNSSWGLKKKQTTWPESLWTDLLKVSFTTKKKKQKKSPSTHFCPLIYIYIHIFIYLAFPNHTVRKRLPIECV